MSAITTSTVSTTENQYERFRMQKDIGTELIVNIKKVLKDKDINFTEDLANSFEFVMKISPSEPNVGTSFVATNNLYANIVDKGMRAGQWVNYDALYDWVSTKLWARTGLDEKDFADVTWKILKKIKNKGIDPTHFAKKAIKMVIGKHGVASPRRTYKKKTKVSGAIEDKRSKYSKAYSNAKTKVNQSAKKVNKILKKVRKNVTKTSNLRKINKGLRQINKYGVRTLNTLEKYK
tara:strand:- start:9 stop:710 length:702 start_codon:yes stop_codon:yes gene_type:complete